MSRYNRIRKYIASRHDQFVVRSGEKFCRIFLDCVDNARHWSFETNGEGLIAQFIVRSCDGDILDVGAHTGEYALLIGQIDPVRAIHLFEPIPHFAAKAAAFCSGLPNVHIHNLGLSNSSRTQKMYVSRRYPSTSGATEFLHDFDRNAVFDEFDCRFERGDQFLSQNNIAKVALLKLDVEGMEKQALQGLATNLTPLRSKSFNLSTDQCTLRPEILFERFADFLTSAASMFLPFTLMVSESHRMPA